MLRWLIDVSLRRSSVVLLLAAILLLACGILLPSMTLDVFPELNAPTVVILTEAPGFAPEEVELYVTFPIESAVNGLPGVKRLRTASTTGLSVAWVEFDWGSELHRARQLVSERLDAARESLPPNAHAEITPIASIMGEIMLLALSSPDKSRDPRELRSYAEFDLRNRLLAVPGVSQVVAIGGELPEYQVLVRQADLDANGVTMAEVVRASSEAHSTAIGGYLEDVDRKEVPIRQIARVENVADLKSTLVKHHHGAPVTLGQVADVKLAGAPRRGTGSDRGQPAVILTLQKSPGVNTLVLTNKIDESLDGLKNSLPSGMHLNRLVFRQADFIRRSVDNVLVVMRDAAIIVAIILILFLLNLRTTFITLTAIPLSFAAALLTLKAFGLSINVMTLGGLAVAIGELVDDAIVDVENVFRRLRENDALPESERRPRTRVIFDASNEVRSAVVFATILIVIVFAPMMFLEGLEGRFFRPLGITYVVSILASLLVALTVTPALCKLLLKGAGKDRKASHEPPLIRWLKRAYIPVLTWSLRNRTIVLSVSLVVTAAAFVLGGTFGTSFLPTFNEGTFTVFLFAPPGTSLAESDRMALGIETNLAEIPGIRSVTRRTGRAERDEHAEPPSSSEIEVTASPGSDVRELREQIDAVLARSPGIVSTVGQPIEHRLSHVLSGTPAAIAINVFGDELSTLRSVVSDIQVALRSVRGVRDVIANREVLLDTLPIDYRTEDLAVAGLTPAEAARQVEHAVYGIRVAQVNEGPRRYDVVVRLHGEERQDLASLSELRLTSPSGATVRLREVANLGIERTPSLVLRENARRKALVSCNVADGANLGDLVAEVRKIVEPIVSSAGCTVTFGGQFEAQEAATRTLAIFGGLVLVVMVMLLQIASGSLRVAMVVMLNLPLAMIGGIAAVFLTASEDSVGNVLALFGMSSNAYVAPVLSLSSLVGFITLFGIAVRNGILLVQHYAHLRNEDPHKALRSVIIQGSAERLIPILMTALSAALGLIPLAMAAGEPGSELLAPLSIVVLGGLVTATFLNLLVIPVAYDLVAPRSNESHPTLNGA